MSRTREHFGGKGPSNSDASAIPPFQFSIPVRDSGNPVESIQYSCLPPRDLPSSVMQTGFF